MASRKELKEQARAERLAQEQAVAERARRTRRLQMLGGIVVIAVVIVVVAIAISSGGSGSNGLQTGQQSGKTVTAVQTLLNGIPQSGPTLGNPKAPVKVTYYGDLECPICQQFTLDGGWPQLVQSEVRQGKVQVTYSGFQTATRDPAVFQTQQIAALAAGLQGKFWQYVELFYHEQGAEGAGYVTESYLDGLARQIPGLDYAKWLADRKNPALLAQVQSQENQGNAIQINGTPTLVFSGPKGKTEPPAGIYTYDQIKSAIKQVG